MPSEKRAFNLRVAAGISDRQISSAIWKIWKSKKTTDVYMPARVIGRQVKCALHQSGFCYIGLTNDYFKKLKAEDRPFPENRFWVKWERQATPDQGWHCVAEIWFAPSPLHDPGDQLKEATWLIESPLPGKASVVSIFYSKTPEGKAEIKDPNIKELGYVRLSDDKFVVVFARPMDFYYKKFIEHNRSKLQSIIQSDQFYGTGHAPISREHLKMFIVDDPE